MSVNVIQDYGATVSPENYIQCLKGHLYIRESDHCIETLVSESISGKNAAAVLDVGCGPGRLTLPIARNNDARIVGVDISESFIVYAKDMEERLYRDKKSIAKFQQMDFASDNTLPSNFFDVIFMQGVMHHIHDEARAKFLSHSYKILKPEGKLIIGDEFIKDYNTEEERILNVAKFYLHIIDAARKGGFKELAEEEAKNLIDDCFSGTAYAGLAVGNTFDYIYQYASMLNKAFYDYGSVNGLNFEANNHIRKMFDSIKSSVEHLLNTDTANFNRGDLKVSKLKFNKELESYGFWLRKYRDIGPVENLGGMAVMVFEKAE